MQAVYHLVLVIADVIAAHCPGTSARPNFIRACVLGEWEEAKSMVEGMLAEPWVLRFNQEARLREFLELLSVPARVAAHRNHAMAGGVSTNGAWHTERI
jgi:hypothetical protein